MRSLWTHRQGYKESVPGCPSPASARAHLQPSLAAARPPPPAPLPRLHNLEPANPPPSPPVRLAVPHTQALAHLWPPRPRAGHRCRTTHEYSLVLSPLSQGVPREVGPPWRAAPSLCVCVRFRGTEARGRACRTVCQACARFPSGGAAPSLSHSLQKQRGPLPTPHARVRG